MLTTVLKLLGLCDDPNGIVEAIVGLTESRLKLLLGGIEEIPSELAYIITEVSVIRFNRVGSEGLSSHNVEGETMSWPDSDFYPYTSDIEAYRKSQDSSYDRELGGFRFI